VSQQFLLITGALTGPFGGAVAGATANTLTVCSSDTLAMPSPSMCTSSDVMIWAAENPGSAAVLVALAIWAVFGLFYWHEEQERRRQAGF
jgi:hypothetical protein